MSTSGGHAMRHPAARQAAACRYPWAILFTPLAVARSGGRHLQLTPGVTSVPKLLRPQVIADEVYKR